MEVNADSVSGLYIQPDTTVHSVKPGSLLLTPKTAVHINEHYMLQLFRSDLSIVERENP